MNLITCFFQAEDCIRDHCVTGVQTCALPIYRCGLHLTLIDVVTRNTIETVKLHGAAGISVADVLKAAVAKLHGQEVDAATMETY